MFCGHVGVAEKSKRSRLVPTPEEQEQIRQRRDSQTAPWREVQRARILWRYYSGENVAEIARAVKMTRKSIGKMDREGLGNGLGGGVER